MQFSSRLLLFGSFFVFCLSDTDVHNWTLAASKCGGKEKTFTLLDISKEWIDRAKHFYPNCAEDEVNCGKVEKSLTYLDAAIRVIFDVKKSIPTSLDRECPKHVERPMDCDDILRSGKNKSGVYTIWPRSRIFTNTSLTVYCDMVTDGGGWTVIQRRGNFSTRKDYFYKDWDSYKKGFGNIKEEFWIGNDNIFAISNQAFRNKPYTIRFDLKDEKGNTGYGEYNNFWIEDEAASYTLHIEGYSGNVGDAMAYHNNSKFSTKDRDNDEYNKSCAVDLQGAWWYAICAHANLNGVFQPGIVSHKGASWQKWKEGWIGLSGVEIKVRA